MRVICIDDSTSETSELPVDVKFGDIYTVTFSMYEDNILWYRLSEREMDSVYSSDGFAPLSDIDEKKIRVNDIAFT